MQVVAKLQLIAYLHALKLTDITTRADAAMAHMKGGGLRGHGACKYSATSHEAWNVSGKSRSGVGFADNTRNGVINKPGELVHFAGEI
eukprot:scaffold94411_cov28-Tisochrysis_lutea.AAC.2